MTEPIIFVKMYYKPLYVIQGVKSNFLASADIKPFGRTCLFTLLLLLALYFFTPKVFLFSISLLFVNKYHYFVEDVNLNLLTFSTE